MAEKQSGYYTWLYHDVPIGYAYDLQDRLECIRRTKPAHEIPIRLRAIVKIPEERVLALAAEYAPDAPVQDGKLVFYSCSPETL